MMLLRTNQSHLGDKETFLLIDASLGSNSVLCFTQSAPKQLSLKAGELQDQASFTRKSKGRTSFELSQIKTVLKQATIP